MLMATSVLHSLLQEIPHLRQQLYFKSSLTALSHAMEDQVLVGAEQSLVIACFQRERFYRQEAHRYRRIAEITPQVYVLSTPETDFKHSSQYYETVALEPSDPLSQEWHLIVIGEQYANCLICRECSKPIKETATSEIDSSRRFEGIWTFDRDVTYKAAQLILERIEVYRPELAAKIKQAKSKYLGASLASNPQLSKKSTNSDAFVQRLVTYLQAGQYKLLKAYRSLSAQEEKERLMNSIIAVIRRSLNPNEILEVAVQELGRALGASRCLIYRCKAADINAKISHEFLVPPGETTLVSAKGQIWPLQDNCLFQDVLKSQELVYIEDTYTEPRIQGIDNTKSASKNGKFSSASLKTLVQQFAINSWLMVPVLYQGQLLGMVELHQCGPTAHRWQNDELKMVEAIATQVGVALIQALV
ncbi:MAG: GAF domain-containing protein, partial [Merismopedia sp. SIO2A8]|nr:GAF domain-containing protein [Merismopedia sp. SIO2A8]